MRRAVVIAVVTLAGALAASAARSGAGDEATRRELGELKAVCDAGLVAPPVCLEKQRAILGLPAREEPAAAPRAPATTSDAGTVYESALGFRLTLPPGWAPLTPEQVAAGFDTLRSRTDGNPDAARLVERLQAKDVPDAALFARGRDTLMVKRSAARPPEDAAERAKLCARQEATASRAASRPLRTYACGSRVVSGAPAFYVERDGLLPETLMLQYWLPGQDGRGTQLVMSRRATEAEAGRREMEAIAASFRWK